MRVCMWFVLSGNDWSCVIVCVFVFSSRRRHTRLQGDWSSDVCSSDLVTLHAGPEHDARWSGTANDLRSCPGLKDTVCRHIWFRYGSNRTVYLPSPEFPVRHAAGVPA